MIGFEMGAPANVSSGASSAGNRAGRTQASSSTPLPADSGSPRSAKSDGSGTRTETGSAREADRSASASSNRAAPAKNANRNESEPVAADRDGDAREDFAAVLAASNPADTITATSLPPTPTDDQAEEAAAPPTESSDQLLALLSVNWAIPAAGAANGMAGTAESGATAARVPASLSAATTLVEGGAGVAASARATIIPAADPPLATTMAAPTLDSKPTATLATLAASGIAAAVRDSAKPGADGAAPVDGLNTDSFPLAATAPAPLRAPLTALAPTTPLALPADPDAGFDDGFGSRITWMAEQRLGHAQIRLNPEHIGPIEVRVQLDGDRVSAQFNSVHAEVRQAIEASLPRLREMLSQHGLQLDQADVGQGGTGRGEDQDNTQRGDGPNGSEDGLQLTPATLGGIRRLLDEYA